MDAGADQALSFEAITADGDYVTANAQENPDLFWALRGGGPSTFAVLISVTVKTFPEVPSAAAAPFAADETRTIESDEALQGVQEKPPHPATLPELQPGGSTKKSARSKKRPGPTSAHTQRKKPRVSQKMAASSTVAPEPLAAVAYNDASGSGPPDLGRRVRKPAARAMNNPE